MSPFMKSSYHFILFIICFCSLFINPSASNLGSHHMIKVPVPVFKESLEKTMEVLQNVTSIVSRMLVDDNDRNFNHATSYCADLLGSTVQVLNWPLATIHDLKDDVISHMRTWSNTSLSRHKTCVEAFKETNSFVARSLERVTTSIYDLLSMLHEHNAADIDDVFSGTYQRTKPWQQIPNITVSQDGSGDFELISDAVAAAPNHSQQHFVIFVKKGAYYEYVDISAEKSNLVLVGEGMEVTTISGERSNGTGWKTSDSATFIVKADGFIAVDIGFENTAGPKNNQAVALRANSDGSAFYRCKINGYQDTLLVQYGRQFYRQCKISGTVDFIFGDGTAVFQKCTIIAKKNTKGGENELTAHGRFLQNDTSGFSFQFCNIAYDLVNDANPTPTYLGRPWGKFSRTVFMQSSLGKFIRSEGWHEWDGNFGLDTLYYGEYMNVGPGSELSGRVKWPGYHVITDPSVADGFTVARFIDGNSWLPSTGIPYSPGLLNNDE